MMEFDTEELILVSPINSIGLHLLEVLSWLPANNLNCQDITASLTINHGIMEIRISALDI